MEIMIGLKAVILVFLLRFGKAEIAGKSFGGIDDEKRTRNNFPQSLKADIVFVIDNSNDVGEKDFNLIKETLIQFAKSINIGQRQIHVAVVSFNSNVNTVFNLNQYQNINDTVSAIANIPFYGGKSLISDAVSLAVNNNFRAINGARTEAKNVLIIITGSVPVITSDVRKKLLNEGVTTIVIGTTCGLNITELSNVVGNPKQVISVTDFISTQSFWRHLKNRLESSIISGIVESTLYPYGSTFGDFANPKGDDNGSGMQAFLHRLRFLGRNYAQFYVSNNGLISLDSAFTTYSQKLFPTSYALIATYWKDLKNSFGSNVYYRQISRENVHLNSAALLERISVDISRFSKTTFNASWLLIVTWDKIEAYSHRGSIYTFQCVVASSQTETYIILNYKDTFDTGNYAQVGFNRDVTHYYNLRGAMTANVKSLNSSSNVGIPGQWIFRVDGGTVEDNGAELIDSTGFQNQFGEALKSDLQVHSPECVFHHNPTYSFCDCPYGINGNNCEFNVTTCFDSFKQIPHAFIRCGYDKNDHEERCFIECQSGYQPSPQIQLGGVFRCTSCKTQSLLSSNLTSFCVPNPSDVFG